MTKIPAGEERRFIGLRHGADKRYGRKVQNEDLELSAEVFFLINCQLIDWYWCRLLVALENYYCLGTYSTCK